MKKILLSMALLSGAVLAANAELYFQFEGENLENGSTLNYDGYQYVSVDNIDGTPSGMYQFKVDPEIHLVSSSDVSVSVSTSSNVAVQLCAGGDCETGTNVTKNDVALTANKPLNLQMDWVAPGINFGEDVEIPAVTVLLTAKSSSETITLTVNMGGFTAGVQCVANNGDGIVVDGKSLRYDLKGASQLNVYNLSGKTVMSKKVAGVGSLNLNSLPAGVYLYKISGKSNKTGKFIIK